MQNHQNINIYTFTIDRYRYLYYNITIAYIKCYRPKMTLPPFILVWLNNGIERLDQKLLYSIIFYNVVSHLSICLLKLIEKVFRGILNILFKSEVIKNAKKADEPLGA